MAHEDRAERQAAKAEKQAAREERKRMRDALVEDPQVRAKAEDFVTRYTSGNPFEDYDENEAVEMFEMVREEASPEELREALAETIRNFTPEQKAAFAAALQGGAAGGEGHGAMGLKAPGGGADQKMGVGGGLGDLMSGAGQMQPQRGGQPAGGMGMDDMLGGLLGGLLGGGMAGGGMPGGQMQSPAQSPFGSILGGLLGSAGQPMPQRPQMGNDPIGGLLGGLLGSGTMKAPQGFGQMPAQQQGGDPIGQILGGLLGGAQPQQRMPMPKQDPFSQMFGGGQMPQMQQMPQQQQGGMNSALMKMVMGGMAAFAMKKILSGGR